MDASDLHVGYRFGVAFLHAGVGYTTFDMRFQSVSGLSSSVVTTSVKVGGNNLYTQKLPERVDYGHLVLRRGLVIGSPLNIEFNLAMGNFVFVPGRVVVTLLDENNDPVVGAGWLFEGAYPGKWETSMLDGTRNELVIDTFELIYDRFLALRY